MSKKIQCIFNKESLYLRYRQICTARFIFPTDHTPFESNQDYQFNITDKHSPLQNLKLKTIQNV